MTSLLAALQFLLVSPAFIRRPFTAREMGRAVGWYPLIGLLLGGLLALADLLLGLLFPLPVRSALVLALWVVLTGGLHLDGLLDSCDGLLGGFTPERRMEIMRDERVGAYGMAGGALVLLLMFSCLSVIASGRWAALLLACALGRCGISLAVVAWPYARPAGLGRDIKDNARLLQALLAALITVLAAGALALITHSLRPLAALAAAAAVLWLAARFALGRIPGLTGDIYGALNMLAEAAALLVFAARI
jgi:adenosylcobinamide-GDP ribazoletransferase